MTIPTFQIEWPLDAREFEAIVPRIAEKALPTFLGSQRWFGDKSREIRDVSPISISIHDLDGDYIALAEFRVTFAIGDPSDYFIPLVASESALHGTISFAEYKNRSWSIGDAVHSAVFRDWLLETLTGPDGGSIAGYNWARTSALSDFTSRARSSTSRVSGAQQSNTSIIYGDAIIVKLFRRLSTGINPEIELGRFLTTQTSFRNVPSTLGEWVRVRPDKSPVSLAVAQSFVESLGDGWSWTLDHLRKNSGDLIPGARRLGELTAQLHLALDSARAEPDLAPEAIVDEDIQRWTDSVRHSLSRALAGVEAKSSGYSGDNADLIDAFIQISPRLFNQTSGFERLLGKHKIRVHGDYHLGQTLVTPDRDFFILDFEGEPQRSVAERRAKDSALKDVAGMLRSFGYARGAADREENRDGKRTLRLADWERSARQAFLESYLAESRRGSARFIPASDDDFRQAISAWELDKALYEVNYELNNRPDWLPLPLSATLKLA